VTVSMLPLAATSQYFFGPIIFILSLFMILLILVQRGKGGGLTGALGGPGGQSAFGTKAGDLFTRITIVTASIWIFLLAFTVWWYTESGVADALAGIEGMGTSTSISSPSDAPPMTIPGLGDIIEPPKGTTGVGEVEVGDLPSDTTTPTAPNATEGKIETPPATDEPKPGPTPPAADEPKSESEKPATDDLKIESAPVSTPDK